MKKLFFRCLLQTLSFSLIFECIFVLFSICLLSTGHSSTYDSFFFLLLTAVTFPLLQDRTRLRLSLPTFGTFRRLAFRLLSLGILLFSVHLMVLLGQSPVFDLHELYCRFFHLHPDPSPLRCAALFFAWEGRYHLVYALLELFLLPDRP